RPLAVVRAGRRGQGRRPGPDRRTAAALPGAHPRRHARGRPRRATRLTPRLAGDQRALERRLAPDLRATRTQELATNPKASPALPGPACAACPRAWPPPGPPGSPGPPPPGPRTAPAARAARPPR